MLKGTLRDMFGTATDPDAPRFELVRTDEVGGRTLLILRDTVTAVLYVTGTGDNCPLTPLIHASGTPATASAPKAE